MVNQITVAPTRQNRISKSSFCPILNKILALQEQFQNLPYKQPAREFLPVRKFGTLSVAPDLATTRRQGCLYEKVVAMINKPNQGQTLSRLSNKHCQVCIPQRLGSLPSFFQFEFDSIDTTGVHFSVNSS